MLFCLLAIDIFSCLHVDLFPFYCLFSMPKKKVSNFEIINTFFFKESINSFFFKESIALRDKH